MVSIIVPIYNSARYLDRCIQSIINQTNNDWELLLVDDGSTDKSFSICQKWALTDKRIIVLQQDNSGVSVARNLGLKRAQGDFLLLLDSDDWLSLNTIDVLIDEQMRNNADCVIFGFNQTSGNIWAPRKYLEYNSIVDFKEDFEYHLNTELLSSSVNKLYRKELIHSLYPEDMSFGEDLIFSLNYLESCTNIVFIKDALYQHEVYNSTSLTHTFNINRFKDIERIQERILKFSLKESTDLYKKYLSDCIRILRSFFSSDRTYKTKRNIVQDWLNNSYFRKIQLSGFDIIWQNRLLLLFVQYRFFLAAFLLVNWKRIFLLK